jgi:signal transduction histidine kinase/DNA-binding NarL/FixJ family response regulator
VFQYDAQATPQRMLGIVMDITERKRAEEALEKAHAEAISEKNRLEAVMEALPVGVAITDARGGNIRSNSTFDQLWGGTFPPARSIGDYAPFQAWWVDTGQPVLPDEWASAQAVQRGVAVLGQLMEIQGFDGTRRFVVNSGAPVLDADGKIVGSVVAIQDITERIKLEKALQCAKEAAEAANVAKSRFLANMSHDLRTPMNAILGMIDVALPKAIDPTIKDCLQTAKGSADLLLTLLNDLLDSARIESGKFELESASFSLRRMLDQITRVLSVRASERGLSFFCRLPEAIPDAVVGDQIRLRQVLLNLVGNAIKFTERGEVAISVEQFPISDAESEICNLRFAVRDTGIGIPSSVQERLFKPFAQADASMTRRFGGTGLGLSISKSLVEMMGGTIWGESEQGKGSTFYFTVRLPLAKGLPSDSEARITVPTIARAQLRILLAEDNPANQKLATYILRTRGHVLEIAGDGQQAIDLSEQNRYDVILMDVEMPRMNGLEAAAVIRKRENSGSRVPIIAMTAHAMKGDRERCLAAGMDGYLSKPVNAQEMIGLVESLAAGAAAIVPPSLKEPTNPSAASAFDPVLALNRCLNKRDLLQEMIAFFFQDADTLLPQLRAALQNGDLTEVGRLGHRLKGTLSHIAADSASEAAERVEGFLLHAGEHAEAEEAVHALVRECEVLRAVLTEYLATTSPTQDGR